jgi:hypothetical protein
MKDTIEKYTVARVPTVNMVSALTRTYLKYCVWKPNLKPLSFVSADNFKQISHIGLLAAKRMLMHKTYKQTERYRTVLKVKLILQKRVDKSVPVSFLQCS